MKDRSIIDNLEKVRERIARACARVGRDPRDVTIVAATKAHGPEVVDAVVDAGILDIGENRVQELVEKKRRVGSRPRWHLIGPLQRNKATKVVGEIEMIHSVDRLKLAETLNRLGEERGVTTRILLEVNTSGEYTKHGFSPDEVIRDVGAIARLPHLRFQGFMTLGPLTEDTAAIRRSFQTLARLREKLARGLDTDLPHLSMGMSDDFEIAVEEGATMIRLGRILLGERGR